MRQGRAVPAQRPRTAAAAARPQTVAQGTRRTGGSGELAQKLMICR
jgi:hypothetical protein